MTVQEVKDCALGTVHVDSSYVYEIIVQHAKLHVGVLDELANTTNLTDRVKKQLK